MLDHLVLDRARRIAPFDDVSDHDADRALAVLAAVRDRRLAPAAVPQHADRGDGTPGGVSSAWAMPATMRTVSGV